MNIIEAIELIQKELEKYKKMETEDGPYIQIRPNSISIVDCYGGVMESNATPAQAASSLDALY